MRIVVDCNVIISAGITPQGSCARVIEQVLGFHEWITSVPILEEYHEVIRRPRFAPYRSLLEGIVDRVEEVGIVVLPVDAINASLPDLDDEIYLKTAFSANASVLITGNLKHFPLRKYENTHVLSPREFLL
ncbi:MAG: putative toxin-antitoxin system toxin component, PIN family [bacterium]|nr:putative toxin-antitoxin system toxin component, PIN family [bacterium]